MMGGSAIIDTNILLRATIPSFDLHQKAKKVIDEQIDTGVELWISRQIIREYISQVTRTQSFMNPMTAEQVETQVQTMHRLFKVADDTEAVTMQLLALLKEIPTGGKQIHDANIVATMLVYNIDTLLTLNFEDMRRFESKIKLFRISE